MSFYGGGGGAGGGASYQSYVALLSQADNDPPTATVLENTLGGTVVWEWVAAGIYTATLADAFPIGRTFVLLTANIRVSTASVFCYSFSSNSVIQLRTFDNTLTAADDRMILSSIQIRVYPS